MSAAIDAARAAAMHRLRKSINATAGQHKRAIGRAFALIGAPVVAHVEPAPQARIPCCASPRPSCMGMLVEGIGNRCQALSGAPECAVAAQGREVGPRVVDQAEGFESVDDANHFGHAASLDASVGQAGSVEHGERADVAGSAPRVGFLFDQGGYLVIFGEGVYTLDQLRAHGVLLGSGLDYVAKYLVESVEGVAGLVSEGTASAQRINRGRA